MPPGSFLNLAKVRSFRKAEHFPLYHAAGWLVSEFRHVLPGGISPLSGNGVGQAFGLSGQTKRPPYGSIKKDRGLPSSVFCHSSCVVLCCFEIAFHFVIGHVHAEIVPFGAFGSHEGFEGAAQRLADNLVLFQFAQGFGQ